MSQENSPGLATYEKYEFYWYILKNNQDMIRFSEVKAGVIISTVGVLFTLLFRSIDEVKALLSDSVIIMIFTGIFVLLAIGAFLYSFISFIPRFENKNPTSIIYFGDIVSDFPTYHEYHTFISGMILDDEEISKQLSEQIHTNAVIATKKFKAVSISTRLLLSAILILILLVIVLVVI